MIERIGNTVCLTGRDISYIMFTNENGDLLHFHFGKKIKSMDYSRMTDEWHEEWGYATNQFPLDVYPQEYPSYGLTDLRNPAYSVLNSDNNNLSMLCVKDFIIHKGQAYQINGLPCLFSAKSPCDTLEVILYDEVTCLEVRLFYTVFDEYNVIARSAAIVNRSEHNIKLLSAYSASLDLPVGEYDMIHFAGSWGRERELARTPIKIGMKAEIENARGGSGHQLNPFVMISSVDADEEKGEVYGFSLIYSGNHSSVAKSDQFRGLRVQQGINPNGFECVLGKDEEFYTPQCVICYSSSGFGAISREYHDLFRNNLMRSKWTHMNRPLLLNNWEGTYFNFTEEKLLDMAARAKELGLDLFVLDDGWFGKRNDDKSSLGDWTVNKDKLPSGLSGLADKINKLGLKFGIWIEPEMISPDSELYRAHPDWAVHVRGREPVEIRNQLILDLSRDDVCEYVINAVKNILSNANIEYVKWDMNRQMTDIPCAGYNHRYTLGVYRVMSEITSMFPDVLFEGCSAGGGRFDAGILAYMPQIWASDNSDAVSRLKIQYSTSIPYPVYSISSHVTASPNHQCGRITSLKTRAASAYMGTFGYELDVTKLTDDEITQIKEQISFDRRIQTLVREGDLYRILSPYDTNFSVSEIVSKDRRKALLTACKVLTAGQEKNARIKLRNLNTDKQYKDVVSGKIYRGDLLMYRGIMLNYDACDFASVVMLLEQTD